MNDREQRGLAIAAKCRIKQKGGVWLVPSSSASGKRYTVCPHPTDPHCDCPDHETRGCKCKHIYAVEFTIEREENDNGDGTVTQTVILTQTVRKTYRQNWPAYNAAQTNEKAQFQILLRELCSGIADPPASKKGGRPRIPMNDAVFSAVFKIYSTVSGRRFMSDLSDAHQKGYIARLPCFNSIFNVLEAESTFDILKSLIIETASPLKAIETSFACDSSGFSGSRFDRWFDHKWGENKCVRSWVKAHVMCGVKTNVITAVEILDKDAADSPLLKPLLNTTAKQFNVADVSADLGYLSESNFKNIVEAGAKPYIPFKCNSAPTREGIWNTMFHYFHLHRDEFLSRYHQRSNVETTFSMVKAKFGDGVRSKTDTAMKNEVLAKILCHNICCLISAMYELQIDPVFWQGEQQVAS